MNKEDIETQCALLCEYCAAKRPRNDTFGYHIWEKEEIIQASKTMPISSSPTFYAPCHARELRKLHANRTSI